MKHEIMIRILFMLLARNKVSASEIASRFEISRRTVYRYIDTLSLANVPILVDRGSNGGFYIADSYKLNTVFLTEKEFATLDEMMKSFESVFPDRDISSIREKLFTPKLNKQTAISSSSLIIDGTNWANGNTSPKIKIISSAIENSYLLDICYHDGSGNVTKRTIEPHAIALKYGLWYVFAYCRLRKDFRLFKISRIEYANIGESFEKRPFNVNMLPIERWKTTDPLIDIELEVEPDTKGEVEEWLGVENVYETSNGKIKATARFPLNKSLISEIMRFGSSIKVIKPKNLITEILRVANDLVNLYKNNVGTHMEHQMNLWHKPFETIKSGTKTVEMRLNDEKRQNIKLNDFIVFTDKDTGKQIKTKVSGLNVFKDFTELYEHFDKTELGYNSNETASPDDMKAYYTQEQIKKYGVLAISLEVV